MPDPSWWPDPTGRHQFRYWDGSQWTDHVANDGVGATDPIDAPATVTRSADLPAMPRQPVAPTRPVRPSPTRPVIAPMTLAELSARRVIGTPDPDPTEVMPRRVLAFLVDAAVCVAALVLLIMAIAPSYGDGEYGDRSLCDSSPNGFVDPRGCDQPTFVEIGGRDYDVTTGSTPAEIIAAFAALTFVYWAVAEAVIGTSLGKAMFDLRVVDLQGRRVKLDRTSVRWLLLALDGPLTVFICGLMLATTTNGHQRLGDRLSDTYVVGRREVGKPLTLPE